MDTSTLFSSNAIPVSRANRLLIRVWTKFAGPVPIIVRVRQLTPSNEFIETYETFSAFGATYPTPKTLDLTDNRLISVATFTTQTNVVRGELFASIILQSGDLATDEQLTPLTTGYLTSGGVLNYPLSIPEGALNGNGSPEFDVVADPGPGTTVDWNAPVNTQTNVLGGTVDFTTDATVAIRTVFAQFGMGGAYTVQVPSRTTQIAALTKTYILWAGPNMPNDNTSFLYIPVPENCIGRSNTITINATNKVPGDEFAAMTVLYSQLLQPA
jgi:hypothetical protein